MKPIKINCSGSKDLWAIELHNGKKYGEYRDKDGFLRFQAWSRRKDAQRVIDLIQSGAVIETVGGNK